MTYVHSYSGNSTFRKFKGNYSRVTPKGSPELTVFTKTTSVYQLSRRGNPRPSPATFTLSPWCLLNAILLTFPLWVYGILQQYFNVSWEPRMQISASCLWALVPNCDNRPAVQNAKVFHLYCWYILMNLKLIPDKNKYLDIGITCFSLA